MTPQEALAALVVLKGSCSRCNSVDVELRRALGDRRSVAKKAARDQYDKDWTTVLEQTKGQLAYALTNAEDHLSEPHNAPSPKATKVTKAAVAPVAVDERPACPACGTKVNVNTEGRINRHHASSGNWCRRRFFDVEVPDLAAEPLRLVPASDGTNSVPPDQSCQDGGKWIPPMRRLCGRCFAHRDRAG